MDATMVSLDKAEQRIGGIYDKIMEKNDTEKERGKQKPKVMIQDLENSVTY